MLVMLNSGSGILQAGALVVAMLKGSWPH